MSKQSWSVFVACYNEAKSLPGIVDKIVRVMNEIASEYEIVIVNDGSTDDSATVIKEIEKAQPSVLSVLHNGNKGIGAVQWEAYTTANFENVIVIAGDGQFNPDELLSCRTVEPGKWLSFYRERLPAYSLFRKLISGAHRVINKILFGLELKDVNWAMVFKTESLKHLDLKMNSSLLKTEICIKLKLRGYRVIEIPSIYHPRASGKAKGASFKIIRQAIQEMTKLYFEILRFKRNHPNTQHAICDTP